MTAIHGCVTKWQEIAMAFAVAMKQESEIVRKQGEIDVQIKSTEIELAIATTAKAEALTNLESRKRVATRSVRITRVIGSTTALLVIAAAISLKEDSAPSFAFTAIGAAIAFLVYLGRARLASRNDPTWAPLERAIADTHAVFASVTQKLRELKKQREDLQCSKDPIVVGRIELPMRAVTLAGYRTFLDESSTLPRTSFQLPVYLYDEQQIEKLGAAVESLKVPPVLLSPAESEDSRLGGLCGQERQLRECVETFASFAAGIPTSTFALPLLPKTYFQSYEDQPANDDFVPVPIVTLRSRQSTADMAMVDQISGTAEHARALGYAARSVIDQSYSSLLNVLAEYRSLRNSALAETHEGLIAAMERSAWCNLRFYCPAAMQVPRYILKRVGIDVDRPDEVPIDALLEQLRADGPSLERLNNSPQLEERLVNAHLAVTELAYSLAEAEAAAPHGERLMAHNSDRLGSSGSGHGTRALVRQFSEAKSDLQRVIVEIVSGGRRPILEFSSQSRLWFDPTTKIWSSTTTGGSYVDQEDADMGRILKVHEDILMPTWRHLWTEKNDFRKSELFRSNEQVMMMRERESEKLINVGDQFRADLRGIRDRIHECQSGLHVKYVQLRSLRDMLQSLGLLNASEQTYLSEERIGLLSTQGEAFEAHAAARESLVSLESIAQADRRTSIPDPIDEVLSPAMLVSDLKLENLRLSMGHSSYGRQQFEQQLGATS